MVHSLGLATCRLVRTTILAARYRLLIVCIKPLLQIDPSGVLEQLCRETRNSIVSRHAQRHDKRVMSASSELLPRQFSPQLTCQCLNDASAEPFAASRVKVSRKPDSIVADRNRDRLVVG
jgi:hypothetical protein